jgi:hypothetical protein
MVDLILRSHAQNGVSKDGQAKEHEKERTS